MMSNTCLFCRDQIESQKKGEHLIPDALGGWLKTEHVCRTCNSRFGSTVDIVVNDRLMILLRQEVGLPTPRALESEYFDHDLNISVPVRRQGNGHLERVRPVHQVGNTVYITAATPDLVELEANRLKQRLARKGKTITEGPITTEDRRVVTTRFTQDVAATTDFHSLLGREAAKIAVEYVAYISSPTEALRPELDLLRRHADQGTGIEGMEVGPVGPHEIWLPRTRHLLRRRREELDEAPWTKLPPPNFEMMSPPGVPHLRSIRHWLTVWKDHHGARFIMVLFSTLRVMLPLPASLEIRWGRMDQRDFSRGRLGTIYL